jgi:hypothetical protein
MDILIWCILSVTPYDLLIMLPPSSVIIAYNITRKYAIITLEDSNMINKLGWILEKLDGVVWTGLSWLRIGTSCSLAFRTPDAGQSPKTQ